MRVAALILLFISVCHARDLGQWENQDPAIRFWFQTLKQPDDPTVSCCGEADAYYADEVETGPNGELIATITDDRPDEPLGRPHVPIGTKIIVPPNKIKWDKGNPTGHIIIFLATWTDSFTGGPHVYCFVQNGGV